MSTPIIRDLSDVRKAITALTLFRAPRYKVADLPVKYLESGTIAFATNALKVGESATAGTGTLVYFDGAAWRRVGDDVTASA